MVDAGGRGRLDACVQLGDALCRRVDLVDVVRELLRGGALELLEVVAASLLNKRRHGAAQLEELRARGLVAGVIGDAVPTGPEA